MNLPAKKQALIKGIPLCESPFHLENDEPQEAWRLNGEGREDIQMGITITANPQNPELSIPINFLFWGFVIAYVFHILEESVLGDVFVEKVRRLYWAEYSWNKFIGFNAVLMFLNILAVVLFEYLGGAWIVFPLGLAVERILNGFYHLYETMKMKEFSSGLLSSVIFWILGYFLIKDSIMKGEIASRYVIVAVIIGVVIEFFMTGFMFIAPLRRKMIKMSRIKSKKDVS